MSVSRTFSPALRSGLVLATGAVLIVAPLALGLSNAAAATGLAVGVIAVALGLAGTAAFAAAGVAMLAITATTRYSLQAEYRNFP